MYIYVQLWCLAICNGLATIFSVQVCADNEIIKKAREKGVFCDVLLQIVLQTFEKHL